MNVKRQHGAVDSTVALHQEALIHHSGLCMLDKDLALRDVAVTC